jgi:flagellar motor switch protein FliN/FliY
VAPYTVQLIQFIPINSENNIVDIKVNGRLIAKGELYTVKDSYGIKITQIITPEERLKLLEG